MKVLTSRFAVWFRLLQIVKLSFTGFSGIINSISECCFSNEDAEYPFGWPKYTEYIILGKSNSCGITIKEYSSFWGKKNSELTEE